MAKHHRRRQTDQVVYSAPKDGEMHESSKGFLEITGYVDEVLPDARFRVTLTNDQTILCHLAGKMRVNNIRVIMGDKVVVEISPYDLTKGRIIRRL